jgi:hypothetical protein
MKRVFEILPFLLLTFTISFAQENPGARQIALSHADVALQADAFSLFNNPAGLAEIKKSCIGIYYSPSPFGLKELSSGYGTVTKPTTIGIFSGGFMVYGFELYKETKIAIGYARQITSNFSFGITTIYKNISIKNYGNKGFILLNAGGIVGIDDRINLGFALENFTRTTINNEANQLPVVYWTGINYKIIDMFQIFAAIKKEINYDLSFRLGAEYSILDFLQLRIGTANEPETYSGGLGISYSIFQLDYAITSHQFLGLTHQFGLVINL